jgi:hypothetical protein
VSAAVDEHVGGRLGCAWGGLAGDDNARNGRKRARAREERTAIRFHRILLMTGEMPAHATGYCF